MKQNAIKIGALVLIACLILTGCGAAKSRGMADDTYYVSPSESGYYAAEEETASYAADEDIYYGPETRSANYDTGDDPISVDPDAVQQGMKIIYRSRLDIETLTYDDSLAVVKDAIAKYNGYIQSTNEYGGIRYSTGYTSARNAEIVARIPTSGYTAFMNESGNFGNVTSRNESTQDVTSVYLDIEARLESLETQETRLLELVKEADDIDTILAIENQLSDVRYQIESFTSQKRTYDNLISYSTITIRLEEVKETTPTEAPSFGQRFISTIKDSARTFVDFLEGLVFVLVYLIPYILLVVIIILIIRGCRKLYLKKHPDAMERHQRKLEEKRARRLAKKAGRARPPIEPAVPYTTPEDRGENR